MPVGSTNSMCRYYEYNKSSPSKRARLPVQRLDHIFRQVFKLIEELCHDNIRMCLTRNIRTACNCGTSFWFLVCGWGRPASWCLYFRTAEGFCVGMANVLKIHAGSVYTRNGIIHEWISISAQGFDIKLYVSRLKGLISGSTWASPLKPS